MNLPISIRQKTKRYIAASRADETKRAVRKHWKHFTEWCVKKGYEVFPTHIDILQEYLIYRSEQGLSAASLDQIKWAIDFRHRMSNEPPPGNHPLVKAVLSGIKRTNKKRITQKSALMPDHYRRVIFHNDLRGLREKLAVLLGFAGGFRRSELTQMTFEDILFTEYGMRIALPYSKTNQEGSPEFVDIVFANDPAFCPVQAVRDWSTASGTATGRLFRSIKKSGQVGDSLSTVALNQIVKNVISRVVPDPENFSCHSLRSGFATYMLGKKVQVTIVAKQLRHKKLETTLRYDRNIVPSAIQGLY